MTTLDLLNNALKGLNAELDAIIARDFPIVPTPDMDDDHDCHNDVDGGCNHPSHDNQPEDNAHCFECGDEVADMGMPRRCNYC